VASDRWNARQGNFEFSVFGFQPSLWQMEVFQELRLWMDPVRRPGTEAMAVDEWLLETTRHPLLRIYQWQGAWGSLGYFGKITEARESCPQVKWVRRWTGGGLVDHREDWTYTLVAPHHEALARTRGDASYRSIHLALLAALQMTGIQTRLSAGDAETGAALCFENPVNFDLLGPTGQKIAGAGQRRSKLGLLHQGSVALACGSAAESHSRAEYLAGKLATRWEEVTLAPDPDDLASRVAARYAREDWTDRR
jgi:lipoate-protein ligase A